MKSFKTLALLSAVVLALLGKSAYAADPAPAPNTGPTKATAPDKTKSPATPAKPARPGKPSLPADLQTLIDNFNAARDKFLNEQKDLRKKVDEASKGDREKLRAEIKEKRQEFLDQQKDAREEIKKRVAEIRDQLKDHRELIDQAKDQLKDKVKNRKGGGE